MPKDLDYIARLEKAISRKYGGEAILNPMANWSEEREREYLEQLKTLDCYIQYVEDREERWLQGWRPDIGDE